MYKAHQCMGVWGHVLPENVLNLHDLKLNLEPHEL